jgi:thiamine-phosphate pyrophosphorylase
MPFAFPSPLYAILDIDVLNAQGRDPLRVLDAWLDAGVRLVQLRAKTTPSGRFLELADAMAGRSRAAGARFIVNDRADIAAMAGADGVHLGQDDMPASAVRPLLGQAAWIGLSTHSEAQLAAGVQAPVTYLAIGPVFATATKARPDPCVGLEGVASAAAYGRRAGLPIVAIGGITLATARAVLDAGADAVAVIGDLLIGDAAARARAFLAIVSSIP